MLKGLNIFFHSVDIRVVPLFWIIRFNRKQDISDVRYVVAIRRKMCLILSFNKLFWFSTEFYWKKAWEWLYRQDWKTDGIEIAKVKAEWCLKFQKGSNGPEGKLGLRKEKQRVITQWSETAERRGVCCSCIINFTSALAKLSLQGKPSRWWECQRAVAGESAGSLAGVAGALATQGHHDKACISVMCPGAVWGTYGVHVCQSLCYGWYIFVTKSKIVNFVPYVLFIHSWCFLHHLFLPSLLFLLFRRS